MEILGLIPARGGSKAIHHKNIVELAGKPLLSYTCNAAVDSKRLTRVILSTDELAIAEVGRQYGVETPVLRPSELAADDTPILPVIQHVLNWLAEHESYVPDIIVLLQPTSPLRRAEHIDTAVDILLETGADTVVSVVKVPHNFTPASLMRLEEGRLVSFEKGPLILRRQEKPSFYARNGPAVLAVRREIVEGGRLYGAIVRPLEMSAADSVDIDDSRDLELAEFWLNRRHSLKKKRS